MAAFLVIVHLGFASATALASSLIPIVIAVLQKVQTPGINVLGMTLVLQFVVSFGFVLPVNSPQGMVAYGTDTFVVRDYVRTGLALTALAYTFTAEDEALVNELVPEGHPSTPGYNDPQYPLEGRPTWS